MFSVGSNNQWTFEEDAVARTPCKIYTFDCTISNPTPPSSVQGRVTFLRLCAGGVADTGRSIATYKGLLDATGGERPAYLKFDAEGYEFETLSAFLQHAVHRDMPQQIALEVHFQSPLFDLGEEALWRFPTCYSTKAVMCFRTGETMCSDILHPTFSLSKWIADQFARKARG